MGRAKRRREEQTREERIAKRAAKPTSFRDFVDAAKRACEGDYSLLAPDADPIPKVLYESASGRRVLVGFDWRFMASDESKDRLATLIAEGIRAHRAVKVSYQAASWYAELEPDENLDDPNLKTAGQRSDRIEVVQMTICDSERSEGWVAQVIRGEKVTLGPWNHPSLNPEFTGEPVLEMGGRFVDPIKEALR